MRYWRISLVSALVFSATISGAIASAHDPDEGMEGSIRLGIPEPMVFDLVRPLGAEKGEFEINTLVQHASDGQGLRWAPEVEFVFRKGTAVEIELPLKGGTVADYKVALQQRLPIKQTRPYTHGLQGIGEVAADRSGWSSTVTYIAGVRWRPRWSTLSLLGVNHEVHHSRHRTSPVVNHSVFHERWKRTVLGVETNLHGIPRPRRELLVMPQVHFRVRSRVNLQIGVGYERKPGQRTPTVGLRLIREL